MDDIEWIIMIIRGEQAASDLESRGIWLGFLPSNNNFFTRSGVVFKYFIFICELVILLYFTG